MNQTHSSAYQLARWAAQQLPRHPGATPRDLYQHYLPQFAEFGTDGGSGSAMIQQHLKKLEEEGLVTSDKPKKGHPAHWTWVGHVPVDETPTAEESSVDDAGVEIAEPEIEPIAASSNAIRGTSDPLQQAIALLQAAAQIRRVPDTLTADLNRLRDTLDDVSDAIHRATTALSKILGDLA